MNENNNIFINQRRKMSRYYIKKNKLQLAVTYLINTDWDNPHTYMDITAEQFAKSFKNSDMTPYQLSLTFGTKHWRRFVAQNKMPEFQNLFWFYYNENTTAEQKKRKKKLQTASLDEWRRIFIEYQEISRKNDEKYAITFTHEGMVMPKGVAQ